MTKIAVIGGGIEGLVTAYFLSKERNISVTIFEKQKDLGGLLSGFKPLKNGDYLEKYYHHWFRTDTDLLSFLKEEKLDKNLKWHKSSTAIYQKGKLNPFMTPLDLLKYPHLNFIDKIRLGLTTLYLQKTKKWKQFENITAHQFLKKTCGQTAYQTIWEPLLKGKFNDFYQKVSMAWMWSRLYYRGRSKNKGETIEKLAYYKGGTQLLIQKIEKRLLKNKVKIYKNTPVKKIEKQQNGFLVTNHKNKQEKFDQVICTLPTPVFLHLVTDLPKPYRNQLKKNKYIATTCLILVSKKSISPYYWTNISDPTIPFLALVEHTNLTDRIRYQNKHIFYLGNYLPQNHPHLSYTKTKLFNTFFPYLKKINPQLKKTDIQKIFLFKNNYAQHIVTKNFTKNIPTHLTPHPGLYLGNFTQIFPEDRGTSAAIREAKLLANLVLKNIL